LEGFETQNKTAEESVAHQNPEHKGHEEEKQWEKEVQ
jgi:hypothetical protein